MSDLAEARADLELWLPVARALIAEPDTEPGNGARAAVSSRPPWNPSAASAYFDAHAQVRETETVFRFIVTGRSGEPRSWSDGSTVKALAAIASLSHAVPHEQVKRAARDLARCVTVIMQLAAVDEAEQPRKIEAECRYCGFGMLWLYPRKGMVACLRGGVCRDTNGNPPRGWARRDRFGEPAIEWSDGLVT